MKKFFVFFAGFFAISCAMQGSNALVLGFSQFNGVFSPFFATTGYDSSVAGFVVSPLLRSDREGRPIDCVAKYAEPEVKVIDGKEVTVYTFRILDGMKFSDGKEILADDVIFSYKVLCDPAYDGASTIFTTPILGINEYRYDDMNYEQKMAEIAEKAEQYSPSRIEIEIKANELAESSNLSAGDFLRGENLAKITLPKMRAEYRKKLEDEYAAQCFSKKDFAVSEISGISALDEKTVQVVVEGIDPAAIWHLGGIPVVPKAYYDADFHKGDLSKVREKNGAPMGSGPFKFVKYENNVVSLESNRFYKPFEPKIKKLKMQVTASASKLDAILRGESDIGDPNPSPENVALAKENGLFCQLVENLGYGYIGINSQRVSDINVRRGLMCLMNRESAVRTYYGDLAEVIERPMSKVSWAYPAGANAVYSFSPQAASDYFEKAGYKNVGGKLQKNGRQLRIEVGIGGEGTMNHPVAPILTQLKSELEKLGGALEINDCDANILFDRLDAGQWDMWVAAWQSTIDPDMYQVYHSNGPSNHYRIKNGELDSLILEARKTLDIDSRKEKYSRALDIVMEEAVEMPVYQRKNITVFNPAAVNVETVLENPTPFYDYTSEIERLEMTK